MKKETEGNSLSSKVSSFGYSASLEIQNVLSWRIQIIKRFGDILLLEKVPLLLILNFP